MILRPRPEKGLEKKEWLPKVNIDVTIKIGQINKIETTFVKYKFRIWMKTFLFTFQLWKRFLTAAAQLSLNSSFNSLFWELTFGWLKIKAFFRLLLANSGHVEGWKDNNGFNSFGTYRTMEQNLNKILFFHSDE